ncbi:MAG: cytochrome-c peroxidase [Bacteroidia bacterium]
MCFIIACSRDSLITGPPEQEIQPILPETPYSYADTFPSYFFTAALPNSIRHAITDDGATLGRVLFYDKKLSKTNKISCASCHQQDHGFSDTRNLSFGFQGGQTTRNSMAIVNTRFSDRYFWDQRALYIESQVLQPIQHPVEMGMELNDLADKLKKTKYYPALFEKAFGSPDISTERISIALGEFVQAINSYRSRYDEGMQNGFADFTGQESSGKYLFNSLGCPNCHSTENFYSETPFDNGLDSIYTDSGIGAISGDSAQDGLFKVPSLRNIAVTAPYMHDGRFATLDEVIDHYDHGIHQHRNLSAALTTTGVTGGPPKRLYLFAYQKAQLLAFLNTLTDQPLLNDVRFSNPFP